MPLVLPQTSRPYPQEQPRLMWMGLISHFPTEDVEFVQPTTRTSPLLFPALNEA